MPVDINTLRANKRFARQEYDKQMLQNGGAASADYGLCGPPTWDRNAWEAFRAQYGRYPFSASEHPPTFAGAPSWVYELMGLRQPPVSFGAVS